MSTPKIGTAYLLKPDDQIGVYRVVRPLGAGGMGEVYLVEHQHLRKRYALKILPPDISGDAAFIDRFRIEARIMADMEHSGVVRVHNFGEDHGRHFLVMDYVEGPDGAPRTLDDELAWGKRLPERVVLTMAIQLCDALGFAHTFPEGAVIHRDLKPGNILIQKADSRTTASGRAPGAGPSGDLRVKIADFGLAKIVGADYIRAVIDRSTALTVRPTRPLSPDVQATQVDDETSAGSTLSLLGTYDYMSPEQKEGKAVDARSDIYALGLILYKMLTGHKPEGAYDPPSRSGVSRRWDPVIARCIKRTPEDRYQDVARLKKDLLKLTLPMHKRFAVPAYVIGSAVILSAALIYGLRKPAPPAAAGEPAVTRDAEKKEPSAARSREAQVVAGAPAVLTIGVESWSPMDARYLPKAGAVRLGEGPLREVPLPAKLEIKELNQALSVELVVQGYTVGRTETVWLHGGEQRELVFRVFPKPARVTVMSNVPADVYRLADDKPASGLKRFVFGREMPIARTGEPFELEPFIRCRLHVFAEGYRPATIDAYIVNPGSTQEIYEVTLEPGEGWE